MNRGSDVEQWLEPALELGREGPALVRALVALVGVKARVVFRLDVETACIAPTPGDVTPFEVRVGTGGFAARLRGPHDLLYLLVHELTHLIRGDHRVKGVVRDSHMDGFIVNVAADALNDAWLTGPATEGFFHPADALPALRGCDHPIDALLLPQAAAAVMCGIRLAPPASDDASDDACFQVSRHLFERLVPCPDDMEVWEPALWARTHHALQTAGREGRMSLLEAVRLVERLLRPLMYPPAVRDGYYKGRMKAPQAWRRKNHGDPAGWLHSDVAVETAAETSIVGLDAPSRALELFVRAFARADVARADADDGQAFAWRSDIGASRMCGRSLVEYAAGVAATPFARRDIDVAGGATDVAVYLDVSMSMSDSLPGLLATLGRRLGDVVASQVRMFSTCVESAPWGMIRRGGVISTGGTSFDVVARDLLARGTRRAVIVSDGCGPEVSQELMEKLRRQRVQLAWVFPERMGEHPLEALCAPGFKLELKGGGG